MKLNDFIIQIEEMLAQVEPTKMSFVDKQALALYIAAYYIDEDKHDATLTTYDVAEILLTLVLAGSTLAEQAISYYLYDNEFSSKKFHKFYIYRVEFISNVYYIKL